MVTSILTVNGTAYNQSARKVNSLLVDGFGWDVDADYWLEFHEVIAGPIPRFKGPYNCSLTVDTGSGATTEFSGQIVGYQPYWGESGRTWSYRAMGLKYLANWLPVTAIDGSGIIRFNVDPTNYDVYTPALAAQTVGQIISYCLTQHQAALAGVGITTDATTSSQLAALTLVPNTEVDVQGERLWQAIEAVPQQWARNVRLVILPSGLVRVIDITTGSSLNLVLGVDPVDPPLLSSNWQHCATRVVVRGQGLIEPAYVSTTSTPQTLTPAWTTAQQNAWTYNDFLSPPGSTDHGTCSVTSSTTISCQSANSGLSLAVNAWDLVSGWIYLYNSAGSGLTFTEARAITANTAASGGAYTVTVNYGLDGTTYNTYKIIGTGGKLADGSRFGVWRDYAVTDPGGLISKHLVRQFPASVGFVYGNGTAAIETQFPIGIVTYNGGGSPPFVVDPVRGHVVFVRPVVEGGNPISVLNLGGTHVLAPKDITLLLAYSRGALTTTYPVDSGGPNYSGTAYTVAGLARTGFVDVPTWTYFGNAPVLAQLAQMQQQSVSNTIIEGDVQFKGFYVPALHPTAGATPGYLLSFSAATYTTGWESLKVPIRSYSVRYQVSGGGLNYVTDLHVSTRQDPRTGESYYAHLSVLGSGVFRPRFEEAFTGGPAQLPDFADPMGLGNGQLTQYNEGANINAYGAEGMGGGGGGGGTGKYESIQNRRKRQLKQRADSKRLAGMIPGAPESAPPRPAPGITPRQLTAEDLESQPPRIAPTDENELRSIEDIPAAPAAAAPAAPTLPAMRPRRRPSAPSYSGPTPPRSAPPTAAPPSPGRTMPNIAPGSLAPGGAPAEPSPYDKEPQVLPE